MKQGVGYTVTLNIAIVFIVIVFVFIAGSLIYFKSNKVSNVITDAIEKYEGYNSLAKEEIALKMSSIGYNKNKIDCKSQIKSKGSNSSNVSFELICNLAPDGDNGDDGYCIYLCDSEDYYYYKIRTNMMINIPILNNIVNFPIYTNSNRMYDFENNL